MVWSFIFFLLSFIPRSIEMKVALIITIMMVSKLHISDNQMEFNYFFLDSMAMNMAHLSIILSCFALLVYLKKNDEKKSFLCLLSGMIAFIFFHCNNLLFFFILFEASLIPLVVLIIGWGKQPERILASQFIMIYTIFSSFPLFCFIVWAEESMSLYSMNSPLLMHDYSTLLPLSMGLMTISSFIAAFLVKVPMFFVHSWLPKAHVEASLEGSIILAGIMLKAGTYGIFRLLNMFPSNLIEMINIWVFCISIVGSVISALMAISSDDLKMAIALSSVSHMNFLLSGFFSLKNFTTSMANSSMISHGFSSSILFFFVTIIYELNNSRSLALVKGSTSKVPSILLFSFMFFSVSIALPPSLPFIGEMLSISSIWAFSMESMLMVCIFIMLNSFFSMMCYGVMNQSAKKNMPRNPNLGLIFNFMSMVSMFILILAFFFPEMVV